jgi:DNA-binding protein Alba
MKDLEVKSVKIGTDELKARDGALKPISTIEIILGRGS